MATIDEWWHSCFNVLSNALAAVGDLSTSGQDASPELRRYLATFYNVAFTPTGRPQGTVVAKIAWQIREVVRLMRGDMRKPTQTLFCDGLWFQETEQAYGQSGSPRRDRRGNRLTIRNDPGFPRMFPRIREEVDGAPGVYEIYLYYAREFSGYKSCRRDERAPADARGRRHWCVPDPARDRAFAFVNHFETGSTMTLCPTLFAADDDYFGGGGSFDDALAAPHVAQPGIRLDETLPRASILMHELFHFALGPHASLDGGGGFEGVVADRRNRPWLRAETHVYFVWAYYLSSRVQPTLDWATGVSQEV